MLQIRGYRLMCGFSAFGGLAVFRQADELVPPPTWGRDGGASGLAPTWPGSGGWGGGVPCPVAPRAPRAGQRPRPRTGEGRAVGGGGEETPTLLRRPPAYSWGMATYTSGWDLFGNLREKECVAWGGASRP